MRFRGWHVGGEPVSAAHDPLGQHIVAAGLAASSFLLDLNGALSVPQNFPLPSPWNLPSRLFRGPLEVIRPAKGEPRKVGLMHPGLAAHPFVQHVEALGIEVAHEGIANAYGYTERGKGAWFHAVDLICEGMVQELIETQGFTDPASIFRAVVHGCRHSHHESKAGKGYITTGQARQIMQALAACEPSDRAGFIRRFSAPILSMQDSGSEYWPINIGPGLAAEDQAWAIIHGIEDGWFAHDRAGFLQWTRLGRDRFAAGEAASYTEKSGQAAFEF